MQGELPGHWPNKVEMPLNKRNQTNPSIKKKKRNSLVLGRVFANGPGYRGSIPGRVIPKTKNSVLYAALINTQHYNVRIKSKVLQSRERSPTLLTYAG